MGIFSTGNPGPNYKDPTQMTPMSYASASVGIGAVSAGSISTMETVQAFTNLSSYGAIVTSNWTANTYKTIYSHTGKGFVYGMVACTAGGAETTTFEITIDGKLYELTVTNANGERAHLWCAGPMAEADFTTSAQIMKSQDGGLDVATGTTLQTTSSTRLLSMRSYQVLGVPVLEYDVSCLIRMKHSVDITNSTATAYSGVMARKRITA